MEIKTIEEAREKVLKTYPGMKVDNEIEKEKYFIISIVPEKYTRDDGIFTNGSMRVDKNTGNISIYNPLLGDTE